MECCLQEQLKKQEHQQLLPYNPEHFSLQQKEEEHAPAATITTKFAAKEVEFVEPLHVALSPPASIPDVDLSATRPAVAAANIDVVDSISDNDDSDISASRRGENIPTIYGHGLKRFHQVMRNPIPLVRATVTLTLLHHLFP